MPSLHAYATQVEPFRASTTSDLPGALMQVVIEAQWFAGFGVRDAMLQCKRHAWRPAFSPALTLWKGCKRCMTEESLMAASQAMSNGLPAAVV